MAPAPSPPFRYRVAGDSFPGSAPAAGNVALPSLGHAQHVQDMERQEDRYGEQIRSGPSIKLPAFLPYFDDQTGETQQARLAYRRMIADPNCKAALLGQILDVAALDLQVNPADKKNERDQEVAKFVKWNLFQRLGGGVPELCWSILSGGCIDGFSVCEKVLAQEERGRYKGKLVIDRLKAKDVLNDIVLEQDEYRNIVGIRGLRWNAGAYFDPNDFLIYRHLPLYESPTGMSAYRAVYSRYWMLDTILKLRARMLETKTIPIVWGTYQTPSQQTALESMLANLKSRNWVSVPEGVQIDVLSLAGAADDVFQKAIDSLKHDIFLGVQFATLQSLEGITHDAAGNSQVHRSTADLGVWYLAATVTALLNDRQHGLIKGLVDLNYVVEEYPQATLSAADVNELAQEWQIDQGLHGAGVDLSKEELYERYNRRPPIDEGDRLAGQSGASPTGDKGQQPGGGLPFADVDATTTVNGKEEVQAPAAPFRGFSESGWAAYLNG
jgi:hypothetical protein